MWYNATVTLNKTGSTVATYQENLNYGTSTPPSSGSSNHTSIDNINNYLDISDYDWMDDSVVYSYDSDASAYPVELKQSFIQPPTASWIQMHSVQISRVSDGHVYSHARAQTYSYDEPEGGPIKLIGRNFLLSLVGGDTLAERYWPSNFLVVNATRFDPVFNFTQTNSATLTHLETGLDLLGFDTGVPVVGNATLILNQQIVANGVSSGTPVVGSPSSTQSQVLYPSDVEAQLPVVSATSISQDHSVEAVGTSTQSPVLQSPDIGQDHVLGASDVSSGTPVVGSSNVSEFQNLGAPSGILTGSPVVGNANVILNYQFDANSVSAETPVVGSPDLTQVTLSISPSSITTGSPDLTNVVFLQGHALAPSDITTALAEVGQTSFVFKGKVGALNSVTVSLSKNSTTVNLSINSVG